MLQPDTLIDQTIEYVAFDGAEGSRLDHVFNHIAGQVPSFNATVQKLYWSWLCKQQGKIEIFVQGEAVSGTIELPQDLQSVRLVLNEDLAWNIISNGLGSQEKASIGDKGLEILFMVCKSRDKGVTTVEISKQTKQSIAILMSRVYKLIKLGIVAKILFDRKKHLVYKVVHVKYQRQMRDQYSDTHHTGFYKTDRHTMLRHMVELIKRGENRIRSTQDIRKQLDVQPSDRKKFRSMMKTLVSRGCVKLVMAQPTADSRVIYCYAYVKDFDFDEYDDDDDDDDDEDEDDDEANDESAEPDDASVVGTDDLDGAEEDIKPDISNDCFSDRLSGKIPLKNEYFPLSDQIFGLLRLANDQGIFMPNILHILLGHYMRKYPLTLFNIARNDASSMEKIDCNASIYDYQLDYTSASLYEFVGKSKMCKFFPYRVYAAQVGRQIENSKYEFFSDKFGPGICPKIEFHELSSFVVLSSTGNYLRFFVDANGGKHVLCKTDVAKRGWKQIDSCALENYKKAGKATKTAGSSKGKRGRPRKSETPTGRGRGRPPKKAKLTKKQQKEQDAELEKEVELELQLEQEMEADLATDVATALQRHQQQEEEVEQQKQKQQEKQPQHSPSKRIDPELVEFVPVISSDAGDELDDDDVCLVAVNQLGKSNTASVAGEESEAGLALSEPDVEMKDVIEISDQAEAGPVEPAKVDAAKPKPIRFNTPSLTQQMRQNAIIEFLKEHDGGHLVDQILIQYVRSKIDQKTSIDRKTINKDALRLQESGVIEMESVPTEGGNRTLLRLPHVESSQLDLDEMIKKRAVAASKPIPTVGTSVRLYSIDVSSVVDKKKMREKALQEAREARRLAKEENLRKKRLAAEAYGRGTETGYEEFVRKDSESSRRVSKKAVKEKKKKKAERRTFKRRTRDEVNFLSKEQTLELFRVVLITRSVSKKETTPWELVGKHMGINEYPELALGNRWIRIRNKLGFSNIRKIYSSWKNILVKLVAQGAVTRQDLVEINLKKLLELWIQYNVDNFDVDSEEFSQKALANSPVVVRPAKRKIFKSYKDTMERYKFEAVLDLQKTSLESNYHCAVSLVQRETIMMNSNFKLSYEKIFNKKSSELDAEKFDDPLTTSLKAIFLMDSSKVTPSDIKTFFESGYPEYEVEKRIKALESDKLIVTQVVDDTPKILLTDRVWPSMYNYKQSEKFFKKCKDFHKVLTEVFDSLQGLHLNSMQLNDSIMCTILEGVCDSTMAVTRIPEPAGLMKSGSFRANNSTDEVFNCNFVIHGDLSPLKTVPVPVGSPCSRIWIDITGAINKKAFAKILEALSTIVYFQPGIDSFALFERFTRLLSKREFDEVVGYLVDKGVLQHDGGVFATTTWYNV